jgi:hypothetical protein
MVSCASGEATDLPKLEVSDISVSDPIVVTQDSVVAKHFSNLRSRRFFRD